MDYQDLLSRELATGRVFAAPRDTVFRVITDPEHLQRWWGPAGFRNTFETYDLRPGGLWKFVMHGPDGKNYPNEVRFAEIAAPSRLALDHISPPHFRLTIELDAIGDRTKLTFRQLFETAELCAKLRALVVPANEENLDRLAAELAGTVTK